MQPADGLPCPLSHWSHMFEPLILTAALLMTNGNADDTAREWAVNRPSRGAPRAVSAVQHASTFPSSIVRFAGCVLDRESGGSLDRRQSGVAARNPASSAQGRWQFLNNDWQHSLPWHVRDRLIQFGMPKAQAREVREWLDDRPIYRWPGIYQDIGFIETMERGGAHHWDGPGC